MTLAHENGHQALAPYPFHSGEDAQLVVDHDVTRGRKSSLHVGEHLLLVEVDQDTPLDRIPQAGPLYLARLKHDVTVGEDDRLTETTAARQSREGARIEAACERIIQQEEPDFRELRVGEVLETIALQRPQIVGIAELLSQLLENLPVTILARKADLALEVCAEV